MIKIKINIFFKNLIFKLIDTIMIEFNHFPENQSGPPFSYLTFPIHLKNKT